MNPRKVAFNIVAVLFIAIFIVLLTVRISHKIYVLTHPIQTQPSVGKEDE